MKVSVIVPSRLQVNPVSASENLYMDLCLGGIIRNATVADVEIVVGLDAGALANVPPRFLEPGRVSVLFAESPGTGQAAAVNAAVAKSSGDVIAFCEDDDLWEATKLSYQLPLLEHFDLVTCNQRERTKTGDFVRYNNFATPSGWIMKRETWDRVGGFDESFKLHVDTEWLGRANANGLRRVHVVHDGYHDDDWLHNVGRHSRIVKTDGFDVPLVHRTVNESGGMASIGRDPDARLQSIKEHETMVARFSEVPW